MLKKVILTILVIALCLVGYIAIKFKAMGKISEGQPIATYEQSTKALLVIDLQNDLTNKNGKHIINLKQTDQVIENVNKIIELFDKQNILVIYIKQIHETGPIVNIFTKGALTADSPGSQLDSRVNIVSNFILEKRIMDAFSNKELDILLRQHKINHLYITGVAAGQCVKHTSKAALNRKYNVTIISDGVGTFTDEKLRLQLDEFKKLGIQVITTNDVVSQY